MSTSNIPASIRRRNQPRSAAKIRSIRSLSLLRCRAKNPSPVNYTGHRDRLQRWVQGYNRQGGQECRQARRGCRQDSEGRTQRLEGGSGQTEFEKGQGETSLVGKTQLPEWAGEASDASSCWLRRDLLLGGEPRRYIMSTRVTTCGRMGDERRAHERCSLRFSPSSP